MVRNGSSLALDSSLSAHTWKVEDLIEAVARGTLTTPFFQRPLKWDDDDRVALFDSIRRGFPIGTLLLRKRAADGKRARLGSLELHAPKTGDVYDLVDGQQRVHTLAAAALLTSDSDIRPVYYDLEKLVFAVVPKGRKELPPHWLLVATAIDSAKLVDWLVDVGLPKKQRSEAIAVGKRLREYEVPSYILETTDLSVAREVFRRTNRRGHTLTESEVFDALFPDRGAHSELSLAGIGRAVERTGFGEINPETIRRSLIAILGKDPLGATADDLDRSEVKKALPRTRAALERAVDMMKEASFVHARLVPYSLTFVMLVAFFDKFSKVEPRTRTLLRRFIWRGALTASHRGDVAPIRAALQTIRKKQESEAASELARQARGAAARALIAGENVRDPVRLKNAGTSILAAAMAHLGPLDLRDESSIDIAELFSRDDPFVVLAPGARSPLAGSLANRILHPPVEPEELLDLLASASPAAWRSHGLNKDILDALARDQPEKALELRAEVLGERLGAVLDARAEWQQNDRPSLDAILGSDDA